MENKKTISICGGVVSISEYEKDPMRYLMCKVLFDTDYQEYEKLRKQGKYKEAQKIVNTKSALL